jgi:hypothetical protein
MTFRAMAREEFWIVVKSFFAPLYGTLLVWRHLLRLTRRVDRRLDRDDLSQPPFQPAE